MQVGSASFSVQPSSPERRSTGAASASTAGNAAAGSGDETASSSNASSNSLKAEQERLQEPSVRAELNQLKNRDREVRTHEQAHMAAGAGVVTSGPSYTYQTGPDGKRYAVGGEVGIDASPVRGDPEATIAKARQIRAAALAPAEPSSQDLRVAAKAAQMEQTARIELARREREAAEYASVGSLPATSSQPNLLSAFA